MTGFEYKVVPAPTRGLKAKGIKGTQARFAHALQSVMNELGVDGWEYQRTDTLPVEERQGLTGKTTSFQNMLVFRRALTLAEDEAEVAALIEDQTDVVDALAEPEVVSHPEEEDLAAADVDVEEEAAEEPSLDEVKDRVAATLTSNSFAFPWSRRNKAAKAGQDDPQLPAE